jgi:O-antigen/teichoic acid export membrane protein
MVSAARIWWAGWSQRFRGEAILILLSRLANVGAGTVFVLLTARHLGPTGRGEIAIAFTLAWATTSVADLGTSTSGRINLLVPDSGVTPRDVLSLTVVLIPLQAVLAGSVVLLLSLTSLHLSRGFGVAVVALSVATMMFNSAVGLVYGLRRYGDVLAAEAGLAVFQIVVLAGLFWTDRLTTTSAVAGMTVGPALGAVRLVQVSGAFRHSGPVRETSPWRTLILDGLSPMAGKISLFLALRLDRIVLAVVVGTHSLGLFTVALAVPGTLRVLPKAVGQIVADRGRSGTDSVATARRHTRLFVAGHGVVLAAAAVAGWIFLPVVFGEGFTDARGVLVVLTAAETVLTIHLMHQALLVGFGRPKGIGLPPVVGAVVMVVLVLVMIPAWGIQGAAWASLLGYAALAGTSAVWTNRELRRIEA